MNRRQAIATTAAAAAALAADAAPAHDRRNLPEIATSQFSSDTLYLAAATYSNRQLKIQTPKNLTRRRVYASFINTEAIDTTTKSDQKFLGRLEFFLAGNLVYRMPFNRHGMTIPGVSTAFISIRPACSEAESDSAGAVTYPGFQPAVVDSILATAGTREAVCPPWTVNLACDAIVLTLDTAILASAGGFLLACQSDEE